MLRKLFRLPQTSPRFRSQTLLSPGISTEFLIPYSLSQKWRWNGENGTWKFIRAYICLTGIVVSNAGAAGVPVGIAVARQRLQHQETSTSMRNVSLSHHTSHHASYHHFQPDNLGKFTISVSNYEVLSSPSSRSHASVSVSLVLSSVAIDEKFRTPRSLGPSNLSLLLLR